MSAIRLQISRIDKEISELRNELLANIEIMLRKKDFYNINDGTADLKIYMSEPDEIEEWEGDWEGDYEKELMLEARSVEGELIFSKLTEIDTDTLLQIIDLMCNEYDTL